MKEPRFRRKAADVLDSQIGPKHACNDLRLTSRELRLQLPAVPEWLKWCGEYPRNGFRGTDLFPLRYGVGEYSKK